MNASPHPAVYWALAALLILIALHRFESVMLYHPSRTIAADPGSIGLKYEDASIKTEDGPVLHGWYIEGRTNGPVILFCHGNAGNVGSRLDKLAMFHKDGASVLAFDYRGYGRSTGSPTEQGTYRDGEAAYRWLVAAKGIAPERVVFYGESLGNGVTLELAPRLHPRALIVDSAFTSLLDMGRLVLPGLPVQWMTRYRYDNLSKIGRAGCPVLILHSRQDDLIPFEMGRRLFEAATQPKTFVELKGGHNDGFLESGATYTDAIARFLDAAPR